MESVWNGFCGIKSFILAMIQWRSAATAPYFMVINSTFWWSVFYLDQETQLRLLVSFAAGIFGWDILLSSTNDRSILFHILTWPVRSVIRTTSVGMALYSAQFLYWKEFEKACWAAYSAVTLLMINPVWLYYQIPQRISMSLYSACMTTKYFAQTTVISPLCSVYKMLEYIVKLKWLIAILEKLAKELLRIKGTIRSSYIATFANLRAGRIAVLNAINSTLSNIKNFIKSIVYEFRIAVKNGIVCVLKTSCRGIINAVKRIKNGIIVIITSFKDGALSGYLTLKNGLIHGIFVLNDFLIMGLHKSRDTFYNATITAMNSISRIFTTIRNSVLNFLSAIERWIKTKIMKPIENACRAVMQFLHYWLCGHWWPDLRSWFVSHVIFQLQVLFNYFCFGIVYIFCGYWLDPFIAFLSKHLRHFYACFQQSVLNPIKIWIRGEVDKALIYMKQMLRSLAIRVCDSILWPSFIILMLLMKKVCAHLYRIFLQPVIDILYVKYKICEDFLLIYCLGPVCQFFVDHIPNRSPFCDDTDTELADLLPSGFNSEEESDVEEASDKLSPPNRSLSPLPEDERDFLHGLRFPNLDTSDSSEAEFALTPKSKRPLKKRPKAHPKDPAPSACSDELNKAQRDKDRDKCQRSSSSSSVSDSALPSTQNASDVGDQQNLDALDFKWENHTRTEFPRSNTEIQEQENSKDGRSKGQKKLEETEVCGTGQMEATPILTSGLDGSFELLSE